MSEAPTRFRPFARMGLGRAPFRGALAATRQSLNGPVVYPQVLRVNYIGQIGTLIYRATERATPLGGDVVTSQAAYVTLTIPGAAVAVQTAYVALIKLTSSRRSQPLAGTL